MDYFRRPASSPNPETPRPTSSQAAPTPFANTPSTPSGATLRPISSSSTISPRPRGPPPVRLRRLPSTPLISAGKDATPIPSIAQDPSAGSTGRRRSSSEPQRPARGPTSLAENRRQQTSTVPLDTLTEETSQPQQYASNVQSGSRNRGASDAASSAAEFVLNRPRRSSSASRPVQRSKDYERDVVDLLDVIDPEVSALTTFNNVQNSLFVPNLGRFLNRQATYDLSRRPETVQEKPELAKIPTVDESQELELRKKEETTGDSSIFGAPLSHSHSINSALSDSHYAVLPHGVVLEGWSEEDKDELNDHVRHLLHSRRSKFKRTMRAFGRYVRTPLGAFVTIYSFLITFWGAAWVLFIIGWLSVEGRQAYFIEICDQILTALFCVIGIGMSPFRAVDTYHMTYIAKYHFKTLRLRKERGLPPLGDINDLPEVSATAGDVEAQSHPAAPEDAVLTEEEQKKLEHHRSKFCKSHTFYRPHETLTHWAFPINLMIQEVTLLDFHSLFQMALGGTTWGIYYRVRPKALTAVILTCSICCNIAAGITIKIGDTKTRKKEVVERIFRQALTEEALHKVEKKKGIKASTDDAALKHAVQRGDAKQELDRQNATNFEVGGNLVT